MVAWLVLLVLIAAEVFALRAYLTRNFYRAFSNEWAAALYAVVLAVDIAIAWAVSSIYEPGGTSGMQLLLIVGSGFAIVVVLGTLFLRWVVRLDMTDVSDKDKGRKTTNDSRR